MSFQILANGEPIDTLAIGWTDFETYCPIHIHNNVICDSNCPHRKKLWSIDHELDFQVGRKVAVWAQRAINKIQKMGFIPVNLNFDICTQTTGPYANFAYYGIDENWNPLPYEIRIQLFACHLVRICEYGKKYHSRVFTCRHV